MRPRVLQRRCPRIPDITCHNGGSRYGTKRSCLKKRGVIFLERKNAKVLFVPLQVG